LEEFWRNRAWRFGLLFASLGGWNGKSGFFVEKKIPRNFYTETEELEGGGRGGTGK